MRFSGELVNNSEESTKSPPMPKRKPRPSVRAKQLFTRLIDLVQTEWKTIRALNLGVRSGTGIIDDLLLQRVHQLVQGLHMLCITSEEAAAMISKMARTLPLHDFQQLQVILDAADHPELSDYLRIMVFHTTDPFALKPLGLIDKQPPKTEGLRPQSQRPRPLGQHTLAPSHATNCTLNTRNELVRFTGMLKEDHALSRTALQLYKSRLPDLQGPDGGMQEQRREVTEEEKQAAAAAAALKGYNLLDTIGPFNIRQSLAPLTSKPPVVEYPDMEARWRATTHTVDQDVLLNNIVIDNPMPVWVHMPQYKQRYMERQKELAATAAQQARIRPPSVTKNSYSPLGAPSWSYNSAGGNSLRSRRQQSMELRPSGEESAGPSPVSRAPTLTGQYRQQQGDQSGILSRASSRGK
ncbi:hypothetical protein CEUSTIGMA_g7215.t1 [Chlamydomonas eustigma]|uniref:Uncharacterized protein n=1 Tax=Chlamydomonas eustigma TaxID=1157962 RepID=A0A250X9J1_9CHLO|nr:hypothetical protein CEUSTIGMA_g7215.t1 [Chlamydomonas eustigma]|eukprot:GAX79775.1 hypothetical protein CEUSTIGMA_g7215.t1 [Chlamydomonas eustigma]